MQILTRKQAKATIKLVSSAGKKLDERIHLIGVSGIAHYAENGDTTTLTDLCHAMPRSARGNALKYWVTKYANVKWVNKAHGGNGGFVKVSKAAPIEANIEDAAANPFYTKEDSEPAKFNANSRVKSFIAAFQKALTNGDCTPDDWEKAKAAILEA